MSDAFACPYCRAELDGASALAAHERECGHRRWWIENFGGPLAERDPAAGEDLEVCAFCGYSFARGEMNAHRTECGQRRWLLLNFTPASERGKTKKRFVRPPPVAMPPEPEPPPGIGGLLKRLARAAKGADRRVTQIKSAFERINAIHGDETFAACAPGLVAARAALEVIHRGDMTATPIALLAGSVDQLARSAWGLEARLDELWKIAPMRMQRDLAYLEDAGESGDEVDYRRRQLGRADELEKEIAAERKKIGDLVLTLEGIRRRVAAGEPDAEEAQERSSDRTPPISRMGQPPIPLDETAIEPLPPEPGRAASPEADVATRNLRAAEESAVPLDRATFDRLAPRGMGLSTIAEIGPYRILGLLGTGGMGVVYEARAPSGEKVAVKTMRTPSQGDADDEFGRRFQRECRILQMLDHPGCVRLLDTGRRGEELFLVMEHLEGVPLSALLRERRLTLAEAIGLGLEVSAPLVYLHASGIVHRDLKPTNVMIKRDGRVVITDFGISRVLDATAITDAGGVIGTPGYVSPEVVLGGEVTPKADQWALARLVFEAVSARPAPGGSRPPAVTFRERLESGALIDWSRFPVAREWAPLRAVLERALHSDPEARYPTTADFEAAFADLVPESGAHLLAGVDRTARPPR